MWLFLIGQAIGLIAAGVIAHITLLRIIARNAERDADERARISRDVARIDGFLDGLGVEFAKALHRDDDKYGLDKLLDEYVRRHHELSVDEWLQLHDTTKKIIERSDLTDLERITSIFLKEFAIHKAERFIAERERQKELKREAM